MYRVQLRIVFTVLLILVTSTLYPAVSNSNTETNSHTIESIKKAVTESLCYDVYWAGAWGHGEHYQRGVPLPFKLVVEGEKFYARVAPVGFIGKGQQPMMAERIGIVRGERAVVVTNSEPNMDKIFSTYPLIENTLTIPTDCTPKYDPMTPRKELMIKTILSTIKKQFEHHIKIGIAKYPKYPKELTLIIADFNIDYPETYVIVKETDDIYGVVLHKFSDYDSDEYEREGEYPSAPEFHLSENKIEKVRKYGIIRKIVLDP